MTERTDLRGAAASDPHRPLPNDDAVRGDGADASVVMGAGAASATAKVILFGEHAVVYGYPAIAVPVAALTVRADVRPALGGSTIDSALFSGPLADAPARLRPTAVAAEAALTALGAAHTPVAVRIRSDIPAERGVGSSAAVAAAVVGAVADALQVTLDADRHHELVQIAERAAHGTPSGLDARAVRAAGPIWFRSGDVEPLTVAVPLVFVIADTGVRGRTGEAVAAVRALREEFPVHTDEVIAALGDLAVSARDDLASGDAESLGRRMTRAHALLGELGAGDAALDRLAKAALAAGALGAKLTGGGRGGCLLALARSAAHAEDLETALRAAGATDVWATTVPATGAQASDAPAAPAESVPVRPVSRTRTPVGSEQITNVEQTR
ncbi:mevalonate kinase [Microbacterium sp. cx-55]|uniref:mevalonate kinase n=1 Tax=Microbacterium sp. cx-55 TaxID=2875948 RepID=UPI001CC041A0|nr:mevalonate kinase [Microbacterium sp. cx-55]MBZ4486395.1 mevalonate kinase [Microbacterium sp. cx-55]UGB36630.1 mevalonate kinase [Microbacterium sp. cx-55]